MILSIMTLRSAVFSGVITAMFALSSPPVFAQGDSEAGKAKAQQAACHACHGPDGNGTGDGQYPRIAGQYADYLAKSLNDYKSGARNNPIMTGFVAALSKEDIENLAAFYAAQPSKLQDLSHLK